LVQKRPPSVSAAKNASKIKFVIFFTSKTVDAFLVLMEDKIWRGMHYQPCPDGPAMTCKSVSAGLGVKTIQSAGKMLRTMSLATERAKARMCWRC
jgi:hypothetical protein